MQIGMGVLGAGLRGPRRRALARRPGAERRRSPGWGGLPADRRGRAAGLDPRDARRRRRDVARRCWRSGWRSSPRGVVPWRSGSGADRRLRVGRHLGLRSHRPDAADGVHGHRVRRAAPAGLRRAVSPDRGPRDRLPPRVAVLRAVHRVPERRSTPGSSGSSTRPSSASLRRSRRRIRWLQAGSLHLYLALHGRSRCSRSSWWRGGRADGLRRSRSARPRWRWCSRPGSSG